MQRRMYVLIVKAILEGQIADAKKIRSVSWGSVGFNSKGGMNSIYTDDDRGPRGEKTPSGESDVNLFDLFAGQGGGFFCLFFHRSAQKRER